MTKIAMQDVKKLRELTGVGIQDAQSALAEAGGDIKLATESLRKKGAVKAVKKSTRATGAGLIEAYVHSGRVGVLIEVNCETDFVAKTEDFKNFVHELALQIAATMPSYVSREQVPAEILEKEREIAREQLKNEKKSASMLEKIVEGKLEKFYEDVCLLQQMSIKDPKVKISDSLTDLVAKLGENIVVKRFVRYQLGEGLG